MKKTYNKLVRDRIPEIIEAAGKTCTVRRLSDAEYLNALENKLDEELGEFHANPNLEELSDLLEVVLAVAKARGWSEDSLEAMRLEKHLRRGGFDRKLFLESVEGDVDVDEEVRITL